MLALDCMQIATGEVTLRRVQLSSFVHNCHLLGLSLFSPCCLLFLFSSPGLLTLCAAPVSLINKWFASLIILFPSVLVLLVKSLLLLLLPLRPGDTLFLPFKLNTKGRLGLYICNTGSARLSFSRSFLLSKVEEMFAQGNLELKGGLIQVDRLTSVCCRVSKSGRYCYVLNPCLL